jgi:transcriptional regulator GlxA family with amidase domain
MYESSSLSSRVWSGHDRSTVLAVDTLLARNGQHADSRSPMQQLRSAVVELLEALSSTLNDERDSAENSLSRAAQILQSFELTHAPLRQATKGGLAPWQIRKVTSHIETNLDVAMRSSELAVIARLSPCHFSRAFRDSFGCSPLEYITHRRVEHAQGLMLATDAPLSQIALDCGFADQAHFSRLFRRIVGESPRSWRRARVSPDVTARCQPATLSACVDS